MDDMQSLSHYIFPCINHLPRRWSLTRITLMIHDFIDTFTPYLTVTEDAQCCQVPVSRLTRSNEKWE